MSGIHGSVVVVEQVGDSVQVVNVELLQTHPGGAQVLQADRAA